MHTSREGKNKQASQQENRHSILRSVLSRPCLSEKTSEELFEMGRISEEEYGQGVAEVARSSEGLANPSEYLMRVTCQDTIIAGAWEEKELFRSPDGSFQVLKVSTFDRPQEPQTPHFHKQHELVLVLTGRVQIQTENEEHTLGPIDCLCIPPGEVHNPISEAKYVRPVVANAPAWPDFLEPVINRDSPTEGKDASPWNRTPSNR